MSSSSSFVEEEEEENTAASLEEQELIMSPTSPPPPNKRGGKRAKKEIVVVNGSLKIKIPSFELQSVKVSSLIKFFPSSQINKACRRLFRSLKIKKMKRQTRRKNVL